MDNYYVYTGKMFVQKVYYYIKHFQTNLSDEKVTRSLAGTL